MDKQSFKLTSIVFTARINSSATRLYTVFAAQNLNWLCRINGDITMATLDGNGVFSNQLEFPKYLDIFTKSKLRNV